MTPYWGASPLSPFASKWKGFLHLGRMVLNATFDLIVKFSPQHYGEFQPIDGRVWYFWRHSVGYFICPSCSSILGSSGQVGGSPTCPSASFELESCRHFWRLPPSFDGSSSHLANSLWRHLSVSRGHTDQTTKLFFLVCQIQPSHVIPIGLTYLNIHAIFV